MFTFMATLGSLIGLNPINDLGRKLEHPHKHKENTERCRQGELTGKNDIIFENLKGKNKTYDFVKHVSSIGSLCKTQFKGVPVSWRWLWPPETCLVAMRTLDHQEDLIRSLNRAVT